MADALAISHVVSAVVAGAAILLSRALVRAQRGGHRRQTYPHRHATRDTPRRL